MTPYGDIDPGQRYSCDGLLPNGTNPLAGQMLTYQLGFVALTIFVGSAQAISS